MVSGLSLPDVNREDSPFAVSSPSSILNGSCCRPTPDPASEHGLLPNPVQQLFGGDVELRQLRCGVSCDAGGRASNDDRHILFSTAVAGPPALHRDGHHAHHVAAAVRDELPRAFVAAQAAARDLAAALSSAVRALDEHVHGLYAAGAVSTGGTTLLAHVLSDGVLYTANVGDCKGMLSVRGAGEALNTCHNPDVPGERARFADAGVAVSADFILASDINVCRSIGDWDLGSPLKWRDEAGRPRGPLVGDAEVTVRALDGRDEFLVVGSDGLWDYYSPESSVVSDARRALRAFHNDPQACADWLVKQTLLRQRAVLHSGTPGDNITVAVVSLRPLPQLPRHSSSRLNLRAALPEDGRASDDAMRRPRLAPCFGGPPSVPIVDLEERLRDSQDRLADEGFEELGRRLQATWAELQRCQVVHVLGTGIQREVGAPPAIPMQEQPALLAFLLSLQGSSPSVRRQSLSFQTDAARAGHGRLVEAEAARLWTQAPDPDALTTAAGPTSLLLPAELRLPYAAFEGQEGVHGLAARLSNRPQWDPLSQAALDGSTSSTSGTSGQRPGALTLPSRLAAQPSSVASPPPLGLPLSLLGLDSAPGALTGFDPGTEGLAPDTDGAWAVGPRRVGSGRDGPGADINAGWAPLPEAALWTLGETEAAALGLAALRGSTLALAGLEEGLAEARAEAPAPRLPAALSVLVDLQVAARDRAAVEALLSVRGIHTDCKGQDVDDETRGPVHDGGKGSADPTHDDDKSSASVPQGPVGRAFLAAVRCELRALDHSLLELGRRHGRVPLARVEVGTRGVRRTLSLLCTLCSAARHAPDQAALLEVLHAAAQGGARDDAGGYARRVFLAALEPYAAHALGWAYGLGAPDPELASAGGQSVEALPWRPELVQREGWVEDALPAAALSMGENDGASGEMAGPEHVLPGDPPSFLSSIRGPLLAGGLQLRLLASLPGEVSGSLLADLLAAAPGAGDAYSPANGPGAGYRDCLAQGSLPSTASPPLTLHDLDRLRRANAAGEARRAAAVDAWLARLASGRSEQERAVAAAALRRTAAMRAKQLATAAAESARLTEALRRQREHLSAPNTRAARAAASMAAAAERALSQRRDAAERARAAADALGAVGSGSGKAPPLDPPAASPSNGSSSAESSPQVGAWRCGLREGSPCAVLDACAPLSRLNAEALDGAADAKGSLPPLPSLQGVIQAWIVDPVLSQHRAVSRTCTSYFLDELRLLDHIEALRSFFLMGAGDWADALAAGLSDRLEALEPLTPSSLAACLAHSLRASGAAGDPRATRLRLRHDPAAAAGLAGQVAAGNLGSPARRARRPAMKAAQHSPPLLAPDCLGPLGGLVLDYTVTWPLSAVLTEEVRAAFSAAFDVHLRVRRVQHALRPLRLHLARLGRRGAVAGSEPGRACLRRLRLGLERAGLLCAALAFTDLQRLLEAVRNQARDVAIGIAGFEAAPGVRGTADAALGEAMELAARVRRWLARAERSRVGSEAWAATLGEAWGDLGSQAEAVDAASARLARLCYAQGQHSPLHLLALQLDFRGLQDPDGIPPV
ncbi:hypothetical protein APUTEX25_001753 [Auxenochlorella protothecoides]|uniref:PPM-type phosphatase domain-containing protein n=1 Tax=Auxenochlorella protothecoides TaxID=3075 RepID=A0A3M7L493_AUXPR|nr:hypothetical protein APUTEX25_001753 [Auxenochlorella protothecoides]|eukprot:RMZ57553.1 hypothetical protein APUTEX25_001753 [Auxenochlorella protothecoides]